MSCTSEDNKNLPLTLGQISQRPLTAEDAINCDALVVVPPDCSRQHLATSLPFRLERGIYTSLGKMAGGDLHWMEKEGLREKFLLPFLESVKKAIDNVGLNDIETRFQYDFGKGSQVCLVYIDTSFGTAFHILLERDH